MMIRVLVAENDPLTRAGLRFVLDSEHDMQAVGEAQDCTAAVESMRRLEPDVVVMNLHIPGVNGHRPADILAMDPTAQRIPILILTAYDADDKQIVEALRAGAMGFLPKGTPPQELTDAIRTVAAGGGMLAPCVTRRVLEDYSGSNPLRPPPPPQYAQLTDREKEVFGLVARGQSNAEIADALCIGRATVKSHVSKTLMKLGLEDRVHLVIYAYEHGLTRRRRR